MDVLHFLCWACLWVKLPFLIKLLIGAGLIIGGFYGGWLLAAGYGIGITGSAVAGGIAGYGAMDKFMDFDTWTVDLAEYSHTKNPSTGIDVLEDTMNLISPVPPIIEDAFGIKFPGSDARGPIDQTAKDLLHSLRRLEKYDLDE